MFDGDKLVEEREEFNVSFFCGGGYVDSCDE